MSNRTDHAPSATFVGVSAMESVALPASHSIKLEFELLN